MGFFDFFKKKKEVAPSYPQAIPPLSEDFGLGQEIDSLGASGDMGRDAFLPQRNTLPPTLERMQPGEQLYPGNTYAHNRPFEQTRDSNQTELINKNIEIISYKIDALRAAIDTINQRLANMEAASRGQQESGKYRW